MFALAMYGFMRPPPKFNGMSAWAGSQEARELMQEPDWCVYTHISGPPDDDSFFYCYKRDVGTLAKNDHQVISCHDEDLDGNFICSRISNRQFSSNEMNENIILYGPQ